ncbi:MAG: hypothetical protein KGY66_00885 [Candidatus Thermoplasmatota archaeon]|nr:hypothetical protein [Candidatus Thermoplasmatota archaeon]
MFITLPISEKRNRKKVCQGLNPSIRKTPLMIRGSITNTKRKRRKKIAARGRLMILL